MEEAGATLWEVNSVSFRKGAYRVKTLYRLRKGEQLNWLKNESFIKKKMIKIRGSSLSCMVAWV